MDSTYRINIYIFACLLFLLHSRDGSTLVFKDIPTSASGIQGQSVNITWTADLIVNETWENVKVYQLVDAVPIKQAMIKYTNIKERHIYPDYTSRDADLSLTASNVGIVVTAVFTMKNLNRSTDDGPYSIRIQHSAHGGDSDDSTNVQLTVLVPPTITSPNLKTVTVNESQTAQLECTVAGNPTPQVNWTRNGVYTGSGVYTTHNVAVEDDKTCYTCIAYNGILDAKNATVCLNVQYKPINASLSRDKTTVCQNDKVNLTCTPGPANPAPSSYDFYNNGDLVGTSATNVYEATATAGLPTVNKFVCVPRNLLGSSLENGSVEVNAKVAPTVTQTLGNTKVVVEGSNLTLACIASGTPTLNVTWTRTGKPDVAGLEYPIIDIKRGDAGLYRCTVNNGAECPANTATINVTVNYKPESTSFTILPNNVKFCKGNQITLTCTANANPSAEYTLYRNNELEQRGSATGVFSAVQLDKEGDNIYTCVPNNTVGTGVNKSVQVFVKEAPVIVTSPSATVVVEGSPVTLFCNASGLPAPNITWVKVGGSNVGNAETFNIASAVRGEGGTYRCTASNGVECNNASAETLVTVNYKPENTNIMASRATGCLTNQLTLACSTHAKPEPVKYRFYRNGVLMTSPDSSNYTFDMTVNGTNLYQCESENSAGNGTRANVTVKVKAIPVIYYTTPSTQVREGLNYTLVCNVLDHSGHGLNVSWHKSGVQLSNTGNYTIISANHTDTGSYECKAHNGDECDGKSAHTDINVTYPAAIMYSSNSSVTHNENEMVTLVCRVSGVPSPTVNWTRNGQLINVQGETYTFNALESLSENYSCIAFNVIGIQKKTFDVKITAHCKGHGCANGGTCRSEGNGYRCLCTQGLTGERCTIEDPIHTSFACVLVIIVPSWNENYKNKKSVDFIDLAKMICNKMYEIFNAIPGIHLVGCILKTARKGSIDTNTELTFNDTVMKSQVLNAIQSTIVNETIFGNLTIKKSGLEVNPVSNPCSSEPCKFNSKCVVNGEGYKCECEAFRYGIQCEMGLGFIPGLIILIACIFIIIIAIILCCLYCKRKKSNTYPAGGAENGTQMKNYYLPDDDHPAANANVSIQDDKTVTNGPPKETYRPQNTENKPNGVAAPEDKAIEMKEEDPNELNKLKEDPNNEEVANETKVTDPNDPNNVTENENKTGEGQQNEKFQPN